MYYQLSFKTGRYIVEKVSDHPNGVVVKVTAVLIHPKQGDLHHPHETEVFFHERKALAQYEKRIVSPNLLKPYDDAVPAYEASLYKAVTAMEEKLAAEPTSFNQLALQKMQSLKKEYAHYYGIKFDDFSNNEG
ncbi:sporulation phosphorelay system protein KapB [Macrococcus equipercicus]|uniref:Kinase n=1 Tax=Macrococcus equipercicus TaxID=69967 RepID=A0A9Q9BRQ0_9STAP|nr:sporulation phosphorelay system protein KapB [Macrococcus equipercicus]KAA1042558.1 kinase [Macrococcus equipercicus]UTH14419.1 kinase [Macrococcus equipercicus]